MKGSKARFPIRTKLTLSSFMVIIIFSFILYRLVLPMLEMEKIQGRGSKLKAVVETAVSVMQHYEDGIRSQTWLKDPAQPSTRQEAQQRLLNHLRMTRYGEDDYIFIMDGNSKLILHPLKAELEGTSLSEVNTPDGIAPFSIIAVEAQKSGESMLHYTWESKWSKVVREPQVTYAQYFYPWDWVVCSSVYTQDIVDEITKVTLKISIYFGGTILFAFLVIFITSKFITRPVRTLSLAVDGIMAEVDRGSFPVVQIHSRDEIEDLAEAFNHMGGQLSRNMTQLKEEIDVRSRLTNIIESTSDFVSWSTPDHRIVYINNAGLKMVGLDQDANTQQLEIKKLHPKWAYDIVATMGIPAALEGGIWSGETALRRTDGTIIPVSQVIMAHWDDQGNLQYISTIIRDISEMKKADQERQRIRHYLNNIFNSMPSVLIGVDADGCIDQWNKEAEKWVGIPAEEAYRKKVVDLIPLLADNFGLIEKTILLNKVEKRMRIPISHPGNDQFFDITVYPLTGEDMKGAVIRIDDVTDRVKIEEMVIQSEKMISIGGLAAGMAHELNNPLAGMIQHLHVITNRLLLDMPRNQEAAKECGISFDQVSEYARNRKLDSMLDSARKTGHRAATIVNNMLGFTRKTGSRMKPESLPVLIDDTINMAMGDYVLKKKFHFEKIHIKRHYESDLQSVNCNGSQIQQVFMNLIKNSAEALTALNISTKPQITITVSRENDWITTKISDNGHGINEEIQSRVFEPFFTTKQVGEGTGLGLYIAYFIITEKHHGKMTVESKSDRGTSFIISLPISE